MNRPNLAAVTMRHMHVSAVYLHDAPDVHAHMAGTTYQANEGE